MKIECWHTFPFQSCSAQAAGDPHIVTLDGVNYTFNGEGDFVLIQDDAERVRVHVHASRAIDIDSECDYVYCILFQ